MILRAAAVAIGLFAATLTAAHAATCHDDIALLLGRDASISVQVEIADDPETRARGLMFRRELPSGHGMLFIYEHAQPVSFWMRNTLIPLDIIFIDAAGVVRHVHPNARPLDETSIPGAAPGDRRRDRLMVLEIGGGEAARLGVRPGMALAHPRLPQQTAAVRCN